MRQVLDILGGAFWGGVAALLGLAVVVTILRLAKDKVSITAGAVDKVSQVTGVNI